MFLKYKTECFGLSKTTLKMASNKHVGLRKIEIFVRKEMLSRRYVKNFFTTATVAIVMIGLRRNNYRAKFRVEIIYCSGDHRLGTSRPPLHPRLLRQDFPPITFVVSY